jgi:hypothetical protein
LRAVRKPKFNRTLAADRQLIEMAKTMDLNTIAERTGRTRLSILRAALRPCVSIKGQKAKGRQTAATVLDSRD